MARAVENVFVDVTGLDERPFIAQHQKHFRGNVIARWEIAGRRYLKVPYSAGERKTDGLSREQFELLMPKSEITDGR